jgi:LDH2 family malate/lactate/ureidoglycolate dehydrogenase
MGEKRAGQTDSAERLFNMIVEQGARLPSQRRFAEREKSAREGVEIDRKLLTDIEALVPKATG